MYITKRPTSTLPVWHALKVDGCGADPLLWCHEAMRQVAAMGQVQPHDALVRLQQRSVHCKVCWRA